MRKGILKEALFFSMTWDYLNVFLPMQHQDSTKTAKAYKDGLTVFRRYVTDVRSISMERFRFEDLTYDFVLDYRVHLVEKGYKANTVNHRLAVLSAYMKYAAARRTELYQIYLNISEVPYVTVPSRIREIIEEKDTIRKLLSVPGSSEKGIRDQMILVLLYDTAIRADELIKLDLSDVNVTADEPFIRVHGKGDKERIIAISEKVVPLVKQYIPLFHKDLRNQSKPFIYTILKGNISRMSERNVERIVKKYADIVRKDHPDLPPSVYPHMFRRTRGTGLYRDGVSIEAIAVAMGHASTQTTKDHYAFPSLEQKKAVMEQGDGLVISKSEKREWPDNEDEIARLCGLR